MTGNDQMHILQIISRGGAVWSARVAHNHEVAGSNPAPATKKIASAYAEAIFLVCYNQPIMQHTSQYPTTFYRVSQKAVIRDEHGAILVCKEYDSDSWSLPGGGWDHNQSEHESLARELFEEVHYTGDFTAQPFATAVFWLESRQAWLLWIVYDVKTENMNFGVGTDTTEIAFIQPSEFSRDKLGVDRADDWIFQNLA